jgi:hypothetical protein
MPRSSDAKSQDGPIDSLSDARWCFNWTPDRGGFGALLHGAAEARAAVRRCDSQTQASNLGETPEWGGAASLGPSSSALRKGIQSKRKSCFYLNTNIKRKSLMTTESVRRIEKARGCLSLISSIAARGASSEDPANIGYALQELTEVLFERTGSEKRLFDPISADQIDDLDQLFEELSLVESFSQSMTPASGPQGPPRSKGKLNQ